MAKRRHFWTTADLRHLRRLYSNTGNEAIGKRLGRSWASVQQKAIKLGLRKTAAFLSGPGCRFQRGATPWNLGKTGYMGANRTSFRKGHKPQTWLQVGSERLTKDGYLERKVRNPNRWRAVHVIVWEAAHGKVKCGHIVVFKAGISKEARLRPVIGSLECITRAENMRRNTYHRYPKEIARLIQLRGALQRQINKRARNEEQAIRPS